MRIRRGILCVLLAAVLSWGAIEPAGAQEAEVAKPGTVEGIVLDGATGDAIIEAGVEVIDVGKKTRTDLDGKFKLQLAPGTYQLRVFAPLYQGTRLQKVVVKTGEVTKVSASLSPQGQAGVQVFEVVADADKAAERSQLLQRKNSAVVSDNVSAETIKKSPDSNAGEIVTRLPAVTVKENKFIVVRGLNERYTSALLNGSRLPSTDPEKRVVPLDLFPADFLEALSLYKSYTPDLPGDFAGGLADIRLRDFPEKLSATIGVSTGVNTEATFQEFNTYHGAGTADYFGVGAGFRSLPGDFPGESGSLNKGAPGAQRQAFGRELGDIWDIHQKTAPPNFSGAFSIGNTFGPLGAAVSGIYSTEYKSTNNQTENQYINAGTFDQPIISPSTQFHFDIDQFETKLGGVLTSAYKPSPEHKISFRALVSHTSTDTVSVGDGTVAAQDGHSQSQQLLYKEEQLAFGQFAGNHRLPGVEVDWRSAFSQTTQDVPDARIVTRQEGSFSNDAFGGTRTFSNLDEILSDSAVDFTVPFTTALPFTDVWAGLPAKFKLGPAYAYRNRNFDLRRFRYQQTTFPGDVSKSLPTEELLAPQNIGPFSPYDFVEQTHSGDSFAATQDIIAGYGMIDTPLYAGLRDADGHLRHQVRLVAGVRTEYSYISLKTFDTLVGQPSFPKKNNLDPLPGLSLIYSPYEDQNLRFGFSQAVARPEFRELSPVQYPAPRGLRPTQGNPNLVETNIESYDLRWEWFFSPLEIVSFSLFYKKLDKPIEQIVIAESSNVANSFANADTATIKGFEFEGRKDMGWLSPRLADLSFQANVSYIDSSVDVPRGTIQVQTSTNRALQGQAQFVVNAAVEYTQATLGTARLLYNTAGVLISAAGSFGLPDIEQQQRNQLDLVWLRQIQPFDTPLNAKFSIENILDDPYVYTQGAALQSKYRTGLKFTAGISYSFN